MIEDRDVEQLADFDEMAGDLYVLRAGRGVSAGVVVDDDHAGGGVPDPLAEDFAGADQAHVQGSDVDEGDAHDLIGGVEEDGVEVLALLVHEVVEEEEDVAGALDLGDFPLAGDAGPAAELDEGHAAKGFKAFDAGFVAEEIEGELADGEQLVQALGDALAYGVCVTAVLLRAREAYGAKVDERDGLHSEPADAVGDVVFEGGHGLYYSSDTMRCMGDVFETVRAHCLAKPGAVQDEPWPGDHAWKVGGKIFAMGGEGKVSVKSTPDKQSVLIQHPHISVASYVGRFGWVTIEIEDAETLALTLDLVDESYDMVAAKLPNRRRA